MTNDPHREATAKLNAGPGSANKILPLTSLRFFAALYVVFFHTGTVFLQALSKPAGISIGWLSSGFISVSFFFVLSGYILAIVYLKNDRPVQKGRFWLARFSRVYPLFFVTLTADVPNLLWDRIARQGARSAIVKTAATYLANIFMLQAWLLQLRGLDNPNWSLSVETIFYLLFPWIGPPLWKLRRKASILAAIAIYTLSMVLVWSAVHAHVQEDVVKFNPLLHLGEFSLGILLAKLHSVLNRSYQDRLHKISAPLTVASFGFLALAIYFVDRVPMPFFNDGLLSPIFGCMILGLASGDNALTRVLSLPSLVLLGEASYALYLLHIPVWHVVEFFHFDKSVALYPVYLIACILLSILSFHQLETPLRKFLLQRFSTRSQETALTSSVAQ